MKTKSNILITSSLILLGLIVSCKKNDTGSDANGNIHLTEPNLSSTPDNFPVSGNDNLAVLGRVLFYDKNLSLNNSVSCGSCHQQERAFCDNQQLSTGLEDLKTSRNTPSIFFREGRVFWDGRAVNMMDLALKPVKNHVEMKFENLQQLSEKLAQLSYYPSLFKKAFGTVRIDSTRIQLAIAEFLKNFNFSDNKFSMSLKKRVQLTAREELGRQVFFSKGQCFNCHHIEPNRFFPLPVDTIFGGGVGYGHADQGFNIGLDMYYHDRGMAEVSQDESEEGTFMVPVLLNVEYTAPYMHDGRYKTLEEVVEHYNSGIKNHKNLSVFLRETGDLDLINRANFDKIDLNRNGMLDGEEVRNFPPRRLNLTPAEKEGLVAFLKTLSDPHIFTDRRFSNPFVKQN